MPHTSRVTGQEAIISVPRGTEIPVTNVSFDIEPDTTDVQTDQSLKPVIVTTGLRYSGSFEYDGANDEIRSKLFYSAGESQYHEPGEPKRFNMSVEELPPEDGVEGLPRKWSLENVVITGMSRDLPADDVASTTWDFEAEEVHIESGGTNGSSRST